MPGPECKAAESKCWHEHFKEDVRSTKAWHLYHLILEYKMFGWWD